MNLTAADMLRRLASGVVPDGSFLAGLTGPGGAGFKQGNAANISVKGSFLDLLKKAATANPESGIPVTIDKGIGLLLNDDQMQRLSKAADKATAEGFSTALVSIDGINLVMDVDGRRITAVADPEGRAVSGIDGAVIAPPSEAAAGTATPATPATPIGPQFVVPSSLLLNRLSGSKPLPRSFAAPS